MTQSTHPIPEYTWWRQPWLRVLLLVITTFLAYQPAWHGEAVFDDTDHLTSPEHASAHGLLRIWTEPGVVSQYYPVTHTAFWLQYQLWGHAMPGYHWVNLLLHVLCALLFLKILQRLAVPGAWLAAAIFALHPVHVESVAWISELKNTLSTAFYLSAALAYLNYDQNRRRIDYLTTLVLFTAALLAKSVTATLPAALLVVFWWQRGRLSWSRDIRPLIPLFALGIASGLFTAWIERHFIGAAGAAFNLSFAQRLQIAGHAPWFYLGKILWPTDLTFIYPRYPLNSTSLLTLAWPVATFAIISISWILRARHRAPLAVCLLFVGTLVPVLGFLNIYPFRYSFVADHYVYLASLSLIASAATILVRFRLPFNFAALAILSILTWRQSHIYLNTETLWTDTLAKNPDCFVAHSNLGLDLLQRGQIDTAISHLQKARTLQPDTAEIYNNLGNALRAKGQLDKAIPLYETALQLRPDLAQAHFNLGSVFLQKQQPDLALTHFQKAVALRPDYVAALNNLGSLLIDLGRSTEAIPHLQQALALRPTDTDALNNLGNAFLRENRPHDALPFYQKAFALDSVSILTRHNLACAHISLGQLALEQSQPRVAAAHYQSVLELNPNDVDALSNLAWLLAIHPDTTVRDGPHALRLAQKADQLTSGQNTMVRQILAAAYAETGQFAAAAETARQALARTDAQNNSELAATLRTQLAAYEAHTAWHTTP